MNDVRSASGRKVGKHNCDYWMGYKLNQARSCLMNCLATRIKIYKSSFAKFTEVLFFQALTALIFGAENSGKPQKNPHRYFVSSHLRALSALSLSGHSHRAVTAGSQTKTLWVLLAKQPESWTLQPREDPSPLLPPSAPRKSSEWPVGPGGRWRSDSQ